MASPALLVNVHASPSFLPVHAFFLEDGHVVAGADADVVDAVDADVAVPKMGSALVPMLEPSAS